jgi:hypothetical protein
MRVFESGIAPHAGPMMMTIRAMRASDSTGAL